MIKIMWAKKVAALLTVFIFSLTSLGSAQSSLPLSSQADSSEQKFLPDDLAKVFLPSEMGKIQEIFKGSRGKTVVLIQDAHSIPDAQRNIQSLINHFQKEYGVSLVGLEGASSQLDPQLFKSFPDKEALKKTFEAYYDKGELTGSTAAAIFSDHQSSFYGIEDWNLYEEGLAFFLAAMEKEPVLLEKLSALEKELQTQKEKAYSKELFQIDQAFQSFRENHKDLTELLKLLAKISRPEAGTELATLLEGSERNEANQVPIEIEVKKMAEQVRKELSRSSPNDTLIGFNEKYQEFQTSQISAQAFALFLKELLASHCHPGSDSSICSLRMTKELRHLMNNQKRMRNIEGTRFFRDLERYVDSVKQMLFRNEEERTLDKKSRRFEILQRFVRLELSREDWQEAASFLQDSQLELPKESLKAHVAFYENAIRRDGAFLNRLDSLMQENHSQSALLVAGGFHTEGLTQRLKAKGVSYLLLMPQINSIPEKTPYRDQMKGEVSWKDYFEVENDRINLYKAFVRGTRDRLLAHSSYLLKSWRDQIIRDLAEKKKIEKVSDYTQFLDEVMGQEKQKTLSSRSKRIEQFIQGLRRLEAQGQITGANILKLLKPATIPTPIIGVDPAMSLPASFRQGRVPIRSEVQIPPFAAGRGQSQRAEVRARGASDRAGMQSTAARLSMLSLPQRKEFENSLKARQKFIRKRTLGIGLMFGLLTLAGSWEAGLAFMALGAIHELGHWIVAKTIVKDATFNPVAMLTSYRPESEFGVSPWEEIKILLGGPLANLVVFAVSLPLFYFYFGFPQWAIIFLIGNVAAFFENIFLPLRKAADGARIRALLRGIKTADQLKHFVEENYSSVKPIYVYANYSPFLLASDGVYFAIKRGKHPPAEETIDYLSKTFGRARVRFLLKGKLIKTNTGQSTFGDPENPFALYKVVDLPQALAKHLPASLRSEVRSPRGKAARKDQTNLKKERDALKLKRQELTANVFAVLPLSQLGPKDPVHFDMKQLSDQLIEIDNQIAAIEHEMKTLETRQQFRNDVMRTLLVGGIPMMVSVAMLFLFLPSWFGLPDMFPAKVSQPEYPSFPVNVNVELPKTISFEEYESRDAFNPGKFRLAKKWLEELTGHMAATTDPKFHRFASQINLFEVEGPVSQGEIIYNGIFTRMDMNGTLLPPHDIEEMPEGSATGETMTIKTRLSGIRQGDRFSMLRTLNSKVEQERSSAPNLLTRSGDRTLVAVRDQKPGESVELSWRLRRYTHNKLFRFSENEIPAEQLKTLPSEFRRILDTARGKSEMEKIRAIQEVLSRYFEYAMVPFEKKYDETWGEKAQRHLKHGPILCDCDVFATYSLLFLRYLGLRGAVFSGFLNANQDAYLTLDEGHAINGVLIETHGKTFLLAWDPTSEVRIAEVEKDRRRQIEPLKSKDRLELSSTLYAPQELGQWRKWNNQLEKILRPEALSVRLSKLEEALLYELFESLNIDAQKREILNRVSKAEKLKSAHRLYEKLDSYAKNPETRGRFEKILMQLYTAQDSAPLGEREFDEHEWRRATKVTFEVFSHSSYDIRNVRGSGELIRYYFDNFFNPEKPLEFRDTAEIANLVKTLHIPATNARLAVKTLALLQSGVPFEEVYENNSLKKDFLVADTQLGILENMLLKLAQRKSPFNRDEENLLNETIRTYSDLFLQRSITAKPPHQIDPRQIQKMEVLIESLDTSPQKSVSERLQEEWQSKLRQMKIILSRSEVRVSGDSGSNVGKIFIDGEEVPVPESLKGQTVSIRQILSTLSTQGIRHIEPREIAVAIKVIKSATGEFDWRVYPILNSFEDVGRIKIHLGFDGLKLRRRESPAPTSSQPTVQADLTFPTVETIEASRGVFAHLISLLRTQYSLRPRLVQALMLAAVLAVTAAGTYLVSTLPTPPETKTQSTIALHEKPTAKTKTTDKILPETKKIEESEFLREAQQLVDTFYKWAERLPEDKEEYNIAWLGVRDYLIEHQTRPEIQEFTRELFNSDIVDLRTAAIQALGHRKDTGAGLLLGQALNDRSLKVQNHAIGSLESMAGTPSGDEARKVLGKKLRAEQKKLEKEWGKEGKWFDTEQTRQLKAAILIIQMHDLNIIASGKALSGGRGGNIFFTTKFIEVSPFSFIIALEAKEPETRQVIAQEMGKFLASNQNELLGTSMIKALIRAARKVNKNMDFYGKAQQQAVNQAQIDEIIQEHMTPESLTLTAIMDALIKGGPAVIPFLTEVLKEKDPGPYTQVAAIEVLSTLKAESAVPLFIKRLKDPGTDTVVLLSSVRALAQIGDSKTVFLIIDTLKMRLKNEEVNVRQDAVLGLGILEEFTKDPRHVAQAIRVLKEALKDKEEVIQEMAKEALRNFSRSEVRNLRKALLDMLKALKRIEEAENNIELAIISGHGDPTVSSSEFELMEGGEETLRMIQQEFETETIKDYLAPNKPNVATDLLLKIIAIILIRGDFKEELRHLASEIVDRFPPSSEDEINHRISAFGIQLQQFSELFVSGEIYRVDYPEAYTANENLWGVIFSAEEMKNYFSSNEDAAGKVLIAVEAKAKPVHVGLVSRDVMMSALLLEKLVADLEEGDLRQPREDIRKLRILLENASPDMRTLIFSKLRLKGEQGISLKEIQQTIESRSEIRRGLKAEISMDTGAIWAAVMIEEVLNGGKVKRSEIRKASQIAAATDTDQFINLLKAVTAHEIQPDIIRQEQNRLIKAFKQRFPKQSLSLGIIFPQDMSLPDLESVGDSLKQMPADSISLVVPRRLKFLDKLRTLGMRLQQVDFSRPAFVGEESLSVAMLDEQAEINMDEMFVPFTARGFNRTEDYFVRSEVRFIQLLSVGIAAQLLKENPKLKGNRSELRAELLKILGPQYEKTINLQGQGFDVNPIAIRVQIEYLARAEIRKAA